MIICNLKEFIASTLDDSCFTPLHLDIICHHNQLIGLLNESGINSVHVVVSVG